MFCLENFSQPEQRQNSRGWKEGPRGKQSRPQANPLKDQRDGTEKSRGIEKSKRKEQRRLKAWEKINFDSECSMSVRIGEEEYAEQSSDLESSDNADEKDAIGRLESLLLRKRLFV